ncbi:hypothetical protein QBC33DRAFT_524173 [Phialemonium atrogriseum]|uniref:Sequence orphan n=1 Tax=Phialemonium atrogriseum TaxID=1093897 RepID=A0AAJ0C7J2_9PEZI|nr:uncharacterized protein QBC33DRAFT_524173 [Phialemonium atrogriseum]KAK1771605.1 hypothetical protein QBC33DRAFT_524173 [Phialemonium atrogriseum]
MENASGRRSMSACLRASFGSLLRRPHTLIFSRPFALIVMVYGGTYLTANTLDTAISTTQSRPATHVSTGTAKFLGPTAANVGLGIYKDQVFVRLFGPAGAVPRPVSLPSYLLFTLRDCLTIFASFNVPPLLGPMLTDRLGDAVQRHVSGQTVAQFVAPAAVQALSTPLHLLGLDLYNRPYAPRTAAPSFAERLALVRKNWAASTVARICRIVPAFGVGGVVNMKVRRGLMDGLV